MQKLSPDARRYLARFASSLDSRIRDTAQNTGVRDDYRNAVDEYRQTMKLNNVWEATKEAVKRFVCDMPLAPSDRPESVCARVAFISESRGFQL